MILPEEAGFRVGSGHIHKVILEIHFDNPYYDSGVTDSMGFEAYYVNDLRPHDAGTLIIGDPTVQLGNVPSYNAPAFSTANLPSGQSIIHRQGTCPGACTADFSESIHVFTSFCTCTTMAGS